MRWRSIAGIAAVVLGLLALVDRSLAAAIALDETLLILVGVLAAVQGLRYANRRRHAEQVAVDVGEPETRYRAPHPGEALDDEFARAAGWSRFEKPRRRKVRVRLRRTAAETLALRESLERDVAAARVEAGDWTDDPIAAAFLAADPTVPVRARLRSYLRRESPFEYGLRRTVTAIAALQES